MHTKGWDKLRNLEDGVDALEHKDVENSKDEEEWKLCGEESEKPLAGVHVGLQTNMLEMLQVLAQVIDEIYKNQRSYIFYI